MLFRVSYFPQSCRLEVSHIISTVAAPSTLFSHCCTPTSPGGRYDAGACLPINTVRIATKPGKQLDKYYEKDQGRRRARHEDLAGRPHRRAAPTFHGISRPGASKWRCSISASEPHLLPHRRDAVRDSRRHARACPQSRDSQMFQSTCAFFRRRRAQLLQRGLRGVHADLLSKPMRTRENAAAAERDTTAMRKSRHRFARRGNCGGVPSMAAGATSCRVRLRLPHCAVAEPRCLKLHD